MAKRRNAKKEKALRNKLNARKFRKTTSRRYGKYRRYQNNSEENKSDEETSSSDNIGTPAKETTQAQAQTEKKQSGSVPKPNVSSAPKPKISENKVVAAKSE